VIVADREPSFTQCAKQEAGESRQAPSPAARMGSCNSKEKELNEDLERVRKERIAKERAERDRAERDRAERERAERERAERERAERERAERDRVANSKLILVKVTSPPPGCEIEINEAVTVRVFLEKVAPLFGLNKSAAPLLQAEFSEAILGHELELMAAGMCDESLCSVLGVEAALLAVKANNMDIVKAANEGQIADVKFVLQHAPEKVNDKGRNGDTALHEAAINNSPELAEVLVAANANVDVKSDDGQTALHRAAEKNSLEVAEVLVAANANVDIRDNDGDTALHWAAIKNSPELAEVLVAANANVDILNKYEETALHRAADNNSLEVAEVLVAANANVDAKDVDGDTTLHRATNKSSFEVAEVLVAANANVDVLNNTCNTALDYAKYFNHQAMITLLSSQ